jgi:hypothetical protein
LVIGETSASSAVLAESVMAVSRRNPTDGRDRLEFPC